MKPGFRVLLIFGALFGLLVQQAAYALGPSIVEPLLVKASTPRAQGNVAMIDCAEMMAKHAQRPIQEGRPCKGLTLACIAQMGCTLPVLLGTGPVAGSITPLPPVVFEVATLARLSGRSLAPEPDPPQL